MGRFGRVLTAMVTPFDDAGALDLDAAATLARYLIDHGNDGLVLAGTTGESPTLTHDEQVALIETVTGAVGDEAHVIAGAGSNDTAAAIELTARATEAGAHAILSVTPYYNRPSQAGLKAHFVAVASSTDLPVMLYDIPVRSGRKLDTATILSLAADHANVVAVKDAAGSLDATQRLIAEAPDGFEVYSGEDCLTLPLLAVGAVGVVGVATHWAGDLMGEMIDAYMDGDVATARERNAQLLSSYAFESGDTQPNPIPAKAMMRHLGLGVGHCRLPMGPEPEGLSTQIQSIQTELQALRGSVV